MTEFDDDVSTVINEVPAVTHPVGYVTIPAEEYNMLVANMQRMAILLERLSSGEKLSKEMLLRALGMFEMATAEQMEKRFGGGKE